MKNYAIIVCAGVLGFVGVTFGKSERWLFAQQMRLLKIAFEPSHSQPSERAN